ncbi:phosphate transporter [Panaeolus papilionaceus]|nr:phosphate transporter [Panaeolus papilionaceus]
MSPNSESEKEVVMSPESFAHERCTSIETNPRLHNSRELGARRLAALAEIDNAKFSWFHARVCIVAGIGFFTDAYDIFAISNAAVMLGAIYGTYDRVMTVGDKSYNISSLNPLQDLVLKIATPVGTLVGQVLFGWLADLWGRKKMYGVELMIMIVSTFGQAVSAQGQAIAIIPLLMTWRFIMGVGVGGDYPLSAIMASEFASKKIRGRMMVAIFSCQGCGQLVSALVAFVLIYAFRSPLNSTDTQSKQALDCAWRLLIGLGCLPAAVALYFRLTIPETPRFTMDIECNIRQATRDIHTAVGDGESRKSWSTMASSTYKSGHTVERIQLPKATWKDFREYFGKWKNFKVLFGTAYSWLAVDVPYYGLILNTPYLLTAIGSISMSGTNDSGLFQCLNRACVGNLLSASSLIPGYLVSFYFIDSWGRRPIQIMGFTMLTILFIIMGAAYYHLDPSSHSPGFVFLICVINFFTNFGANVTTFVIPGEAFPTRYRSTCHGLSAGMGKVGAIVGQVVISAGQIHKQSKDRNVPSEMNTLPHGMTATFLIFAAFMLTGIASTWFLLPETKQKTLEELSNESQDASVMDGFTSSRRITQKPI